MSKSAETKHKKFEEKKDLRQKQIAIPSPSQNVFVCRSAVKLDGSKLWLPGNSR